MFGKGGLGNLMKQAQQMQDRMQKMQEEIAQLEVTGESGAAAIKSSSISLSSSIKEGSMSIRRQLCWKT